MTFKPAASRTVVYALSGRAPAPQPLAWPMKVPADVLDYSLDLRPWLADGGDSVEACSAQFITTGISGDFEITKPPSPANVLTLWLGGGTPGTIYDVRFQIATTGGRSIEADVWVGVNVHGACNLSNFTTLQSLSAMLAFAPQRPSGGIWVDNQDGNGGVLHWSGAASAITVAAPLSFSDLENLLSQMPTVPAPGLWRDGENGVIHWSAS